MDINKMSNMLNGAFDHSHQQPKPSTAKRFSNRKKQRRVQRHQRKHPARARKKSKAATVRPTSSAGTGRGMIPWSLTLDYRSIGILNALEKLYGLSNRDEAFRLLFDKSLKSLIKAKGRSGKEKFELNRKVYDMDTRPKAIARHQKFGR